MEIDQYVLQDWITYFCSTYPKQTHRLQWYSCSTYYQNSHRREMPKQLQKIYVSLWKHAAVRIRHIILTLCQIFIPVVLLWVISSISKSYATLDPAEVRSSSSLEHYVSHIHCAPSTSFTKQLMNSVDAALQSVRQTIVGVKNEDDSIHAFNTSKDVNLNGIIFNDTKEAKLAKILKYRMRSEENLKINETFDADAPKRPSMKSEQNINTGIGALQLYIISLLIDMVRKEAGVYNKDINITLSVQELSYLHQKKDKHYSENESPVTLLVLGFTVSCLIMQRIVREKETGVKELLILNGLGTWMFWFCWLLDELFVNMISVTCTSLLLKHYYFKTTDATLLLAFLTLFCISLIFFMFATSSFFENSTLVVLIGFFLYLAPFITAKAIKSPGITFDKLLCLFPLGGLYYGMFIILMYEKKGDGLQWNDLNFPPVDYPDDVTMADVFLFYFVGIIIFTLVTWYMDAVKPGKYGVAKPWYYLFMVCFCRKISKENWEIQSNVTQNFERPPDNLMAGIRIKNLYKVYPSIRKSESKVVVNGVTLDIYHGEITALLGHNGAGKTTMMSILSGMLSATSGSVMINDYDTKNNMSKIRENLGLCPQSNILIPDLTLQQHLIFFGMLKGLSRKTAEDISKDIMNKLDFTEKKHCLPSKLSGGMKRKLSLGIALTGDAKVLILDEPTSGMDVEVRRLVWNLLLGMKGQKTILISTHYMEEADVLGDRVAIMDHGKIKCYGTSLFLKKIYGTGYNLSVIKLDGCNESAVWDTVTKIIPEATIKNLNGPVMYFSLPLDQTSKYPKLFDSLESQQQKLQIGGFGVSLSTLEDVFLNVAKESEDDANEYGSIRSETNDESHTLVGTAGALTKSRVSGLKLIVRQFPVLLLNNVLFTYKHWFSHLITVLLALFLTSMATIISTNLVEKVETTAVTNSPAGQHEALTFDIVIYVLTLIWMFIIFIGVLLLLSNYIAFPLLERVSKSKHIKFLAGVNPITYWLVHFLWDFVCYSVAMITLLITVIVFGHQGLVTKPDILGVFLMLLILHGFAAIPYTYVISYVTRTVSSAILLLVILNLIVGFGGCIVMGMLELINHFIATMTQKLDYFGLTFPDAVLHLIPLYTLSRSLLKYGRITFKKLSCMDKKMPSLEEDMPYFAETYPNQLDLTKDVMFFGIDCILFFSILLLIEFGWVKKLYVLIESQVFNKRIVRDEDEDEDVKEEELRVKKQVQGVERKDTLLAYNLVKKYRNFPAVKGISFGVHEGECFGLLGANGAGKTTTFQMLTGDITPTSGNVLAFGYKLSQNKWKYLSHIGYCPQFDGLDEHLTGNEILSMYAKLHGVPDDMITSQVNSWINLLGLNDYCKKVCRTYSGGNKRKLNAAVALIGNPPIVFLDEPTTGVDPLSRRKLWNILRGIQKTGQVVVLTSHSMEECEALCTRLTIMVAGQFKCFGNVQYLKQKFGQGFTVIIKMESAESDTQEVKSWFEEKKFPNICILKDEHLGLLQYQITDPKVTLKQLFTTLEEMKKSVKLVEDYAVSETTLEQIFLSLAKRNRDRIASV